jgi:phage baseplate assembly protein W
MAVASATDLEGRDLGDGRVSLRWMHPEAGGPLGIRFDVHGSRDPLRPLGAVVLADLADTTATAAGFEEGGVAYFTVVARRGTELALPSATARVAIDPVLSPVELTSSGGEGPPVGLAFPFGIDASGGVRAEGGDPLLRGKVLQLLLTAPGERVNLPDYGTRLRDLVFEPSNDILAAATEFAILRALRRWLGTEIQVDGVRVSSDDSELSVDVTYLRTADLTMERLRVGIPIPR